MHGEGSYSSAGQQPHLYRQEGRSAASSTRPVMAMAQAPYQPVQPRSGAFMHPQGHAVPLVHPIITPSAPVRGGTFPYPQGQAVLLAHPAPARGGAFMPPQGHPAPLAHTIMATAPSQQNLPRTHSGVEFDVTSTDDAVSGVRRAATKMKAAFQGVWSFIPTNRQSKIKNKIATAIARVGERNFQTALKKLIGTQLPESVSGELFLVLAQNMMTSATKSFDSYTTPPQRDNIESAGASASLPNDSVLNGEELKLIVEFLKTVKAQQHMAAQTQQQRTTSPPQPTSSQAQHQMSAHAMTGGGYRGGMPCFTAYPQQTHPQQTHPHMMASHMQSPMHAASANTDIIFETVGMTLQSTGMVSPATGQTVYKTSLNNGRTTLYLEPTGQRDTQGRSAYRNVTAAFTAAMHAQSAQAYNGLQAHR